MVDTALKALRLGRQTFPGIWAFMMPPELLRLRFPDEKQADCSACPKVCEASWRPDYRCCTYQPRISNFLLGLALRTPAGERAVDDVIARGMLLPEGMHSSPQQWLDFVDDQQQDLYGKSTRVLCPMLDTTSGLCRVHAFRNAVCSTYFCHKDQGSAGEVFWGQIQTLGTQLEMRLSRWSLQKVGFDVEASLRSLNDLAPHIDRVSGADGWQPSALQKIWGAYYGREKELLAACAAVILEHKDELWTLAQDLEIVEASAWNAALDALSDEDDDEGEAEPMNLKELWDDCLAAHDALWTPPVGRYTLSPNVQFIGDILEYRFQNPEKTLAFTLPVSASEKERLLSFLGAKKQLDDDDFQRNMMHRKVLWKV